MGPLPRSFHSVVPPSFCIVLGSEGSAKLSSVKLADPCNLTLRLPGPPTISRPKYALVHWIMNTSDCHLERVVATRSGVTEQPSFSVGSFFEASFVVITCIRRSALLFIKPVLKILFYLFIVVRINPKNPEPISVSEVDQFASAIGPECRYIFEFLERCWMRRIGKAE